MFVLVLVAQGLKKSLSVNNDPTLAYISAETCTSMLGYGNSSWVRYP